jgi:2-methylcitrate dehydratase PrpD
MLSISRDGRSLYTRELGTRWGLANAAYKPWPVGWRMTHGLTALDALMARNAIDVDSIERVVVETTPLVLTLSQSTDPHPDNFYKRQFSFVHGFAMKLLGVPPNASWLSPDEELERKAAALRNKIELKAHPVAMNHASDIARGEYRRVMSGVTIHANGQVYKEECDRARGDARHEGFAWNDEDVARKFRTLVGSEQDESVIDKILGIEALADVTSITDFLADRSAGQPAAQKGSAT